MAESLSARTVSFLWNSVQKSVDAAKRLSNSVFGATIPSGQFVTQFDLRYGNQHPPFLDCSYTEALTKARSQTKVILVYLHCELNGDSEDFCRALTNPEVSQHITDNFLLWGADIRSKEGFKAAAALQPPAFPFFAAIASTNDGFVAVGSKMGSDAQDDLLNWLRAITTAHQAAFVAPARAQREERVSAADIIDEQDRAVEESIRRDRERQREREARDREAQLALEAEERERELVRQKELEEQRRIEQQRRAQEDALAHLPAEPAAGPGVCTVVLKLPDGKRVTRNFPGESPLHAVQLLCTGHGFDPAVYALCSNYPRRKFTGADSSSSLSSLGLIPQAVLFLEEQ